MGTHAAPPWKGAKHGPTFRPTLLWHGRPSPQLPSSCQLPQLHLTYLTCSWCLRWGAPVWLLVQVCLTRVPGLSWRAWRCLRDPTCSRFSRTPTCDRRTDGRTDKWTDGQTDTRRRLITALTTRVARVKIDIAQKKWPISCELYRFLF